MKYRCWIMAILAFSVVSVQSAEIGRASDTKKARKLCTQATEALKSGRVEEGRGLFRKALEIAPDFPDAHVGLGQMAMAEQRYKDAYAAFQRAETAYIEYANEVIRRAQQNENAKMDEMARLADASSQVAISSSKSGAAPMAQAKLYNRAQQLAISDGPLPTSVELTNPLGQIDYYAGNALFRLGELAGAIDYFEASVKYSPLHLPSYVNLAIAYWKSGRSEDALSALARAEAQGLKVDPKLRADISAAPSAAQ